MQVTGELVLSGLWIHSDLVHAPNLFATLVLNCEDRGWISEFTSKIVSRLKLLHACHKLLPILGGLLCQERGTATWCSPQCGLTQDPAGSDSISISVSNILSLYSIDLKPSQVFKVLACCRTASPGHLPKELIDLTEAS